MSRKHKQNAHEKHLSNMFGMSVPDVIAYAKEKLKVKKITHTVEKITFTYRHWNYELDIKDGTISSGGIEHEDYWK